MEQIKFSFIIPHRNIPILLERCIDSIPKREDSEIIIVDDNSDEDVLSYLTNIESRHLNTFFIKNDHFKGAGFARNIGIDVARGKWLLFIDADDFFYPSINQIMDKYINSEIDIIYFLSDSCLSDNINIKANKSSAMMEVIAMYKQKPQKKELFLRLKYAVPWGKMIKTELVKSKSIRYDEVLAGNDVLFSAKTGYYASKVIVEDLIAYCITERSDSLVRIESQEIVDQRIESRIHLMNFCRSIGLPQYRHPIGELVIFYRRFGIKQCIQKLLYIIQAGYGIRYLVIDILKNIILYPQRKLRYVFSK